MLSFGVTPFTDLPAHRIIRSYFKKRTDHDEERVTVDSELSHLWSEERRHEEYQFAALMAELTSIAKVLGVVVSGTSDLASTLGEPIPELKPCGRVEMALRTENERIYSQIVKRARASPAIVHACKDLDAECLTEERLKSLGVLRQDQWLNDINAKVQTLLQEAHNLLGPAVNSSSTSENFPELGNDWHNGKNRSNNGGGDDHDFSFDVISLYMRDEASLTFEVPTFVEGGEGSSHDKGIATSRSDGDWLPGLGDVSMDTADTSFSLDYSLDNPHCKGDPGECICDGSLMNGTGKPIEVAVDEQPQMWLDDI
ncbi:hypothetical protein AX15_001894 [Amanita polypyramis BW_CC]|nr:hypothetical protein AX15_001894 [Amanita polypyramis BW_CC]